MNNYKTKEDLLAFFKKLEALPEKNLWTWNRIGEGELCPPHLDITNGIIRYAYGGQVQLATFGSVSKEIEPECRNLIFVFNQNAIVKWNKIQKKRQADRDNYWFQ